MYMKFCVIGYGRWGKNLYNTLVNLVGKENVYVYDSDEQNTKKIRNSLQSVEEVIQNKDISNILISTPASTHFELSHKFLEAKKNIFCEKPVSLSTKEVNSLIQTSRKNKNVFLVGHTFLFNDSINYIKKNIKNNKINLKIISGRYSSYSTNVNDVNVLWDFGPHVISISNYIVGEEVVDAKIIPLYFDQRGQLAACNINLVYKNGVNSIFELSWLSIDKKREIDFIGESKMYRWNDLKPTSPIEYIKKVFPEKNIVGPYKHFHTILNKKEIPAIQQSAPLENELNYFISNIKKNNYSNHLSNLTFSYEVIKVIEDLEKQLI